MISCLRTFERKIALRLKVQWCSSNWGWRGNELWKIKVIPWYRKSFFSKLLFSWITGNAPKSEQTCKRTYLVLAFMMVTAKQNTHRKSKQWFPKVRLEYKIPQKRKEHRNGYCLDFCRCEIWFHCTKGIGLISFR